MVAVKRIGVLTSGGDAPGMNACIRSVVRTGLANNTRVLGVYNGFEGLIDGEYRPLGARDVGGILQRGGTILQTRRSKRFMEKTGQRDAIRKMNEAGMDALLEDAVRKWMDAEWPFEWVVYPGRGSAEMSGGKTN